MLVQMSLNLSLRQISLNFVMRVASPGGGGVETRLSKKYQKGTSISHYAYGVAFPEGADTQLFVRKYQKGTSTSHYTYGVAFPEGADTQLFSNKLLLSQ